MSALYQLLLLNPQRGCSILSGLCEWERSRRLTDTWAANTPCWASLGELGWEGCANEEILLSSCGLTPSAPQLLPSKAPPRQETQTPCPAHPPKPTKPKKPPAYKCKSFESSSSSLSDQALPGGQGKEVKGKQPLQQKRREEPPSLEGDESPNPLLGAQVFVPYTEGVYPGVVTLVVGGAGGESLGGTPRGKGDVSGSVVCLSHFSTDPLGAAEGCSCSEEGRQGQKEAQPQTGRWTAG